MSSKNVEESRRFLNVYYMITKHSLPISIDLKYKAFYNRRSMERFHVISGSSVSKVNVFFCVMGTDILSLIQHS